MVGITIEKTVLASDGKSYKISVTYGADANLPADVDLSVIELEQGDEEYNRYLDESAAKLGKEAADISYARIRHPTPIISAKQSWKKVRERIPGLM